MMPLAVGKRARVCLDVAAKQMQDGQHKQGPFPLNSPHPFAAFRASVSNLRNWINRAALHLNPPNEQGRHATLLHFTTGATWPSASDPWR
jgi:hypothetical protein